MVNLIISYENNTKLPNLTNCQYSDAEQGDTISRDVISIMIKLNSTTFEEYQEYCGIGALM